MKNGKKQGRKEGSWFDKRLAVFKEANVGCTGIAQHCELIPNALLVRNCIVHAGGRVEKCRSPKKVKSAVQWLSNRAKRTNERFASIRDGFLYLGDDIVAEMIIASRAAIRHLDKHRPEST